jgi:aldose 1-epimerase
MNRDRKSVLAIGIATMAAVAGCGDVEPATTSESAAAEAVVERAPFGMADGRAVELVTLRNGNGIELKATNYGGIITSLMTPDRNGVMGDIVLGFETIEPYVAGTPYFGAIIGRYGNRIGGARFTLDGETHQLTVNDGPNHLHGGAKGFDKVVWDAESFENDVGRGVTFRYTSPAGEEGYPGTLQATVTYTLTEANELIVDYLATTDRATPVTLTQHSYFNLAAPGSGAGAGAGSGGTDILGHELTINASGYTPVNETLIPTGEIASVEGTPFDFREATAIGARIDADHPQLAAGGGYDHNWVLDRTGDGLELAARVVEPTSGRTLEIRTTEPGIQFYSGNFLDGTITGRNGVTYVHRGGFCLETQHYPDSPNEPSFPSTILRPGEEYRSRTVFSFGVAG